MLRLQVDNGDQSKKSLKLSVKTWMDQQIIQLRSYMKKFSVGPSVAASDIYTESIPKAA